MEKFRELEKEYKQKKLTKVVYQNNNEIESKYISGEDSDYGHEYNDYDDSRSDDSLYGEDQAKYSEKVSLSGL
jgi:hypothetical protein